MNERALKCLVLALTVYHGWTKADVARLLSLVMTIHEEEKDEDLFRVDVGQMSTDQRIAANEFQKQLDDGAELVRVWATSVEEIRP